jgi:hypothetical protein
MSFADAQALASRRQPEFASDCLPDHLHALLGFLNFPPA